MQTMNTQNQQEHTSRPASRAKAVRVNYSLPQVYTDKVRKLSEQTGLGMSEIVRRALDEYFEGQKERASGGKVNPDGF